MSTIVEEPETIKYNLRRPSSVSNTKKIPLKSEAVKKRNLCSKRRRNLTNFVEFSTKQVAFSRKFAENDANFDTVQDFDHGYHQTTSLEDAKPEPVETGTTGFYRELFVSRPCMSDFDAEDVSKSNLLYVNDKIDVESIDPIDLPPKLARMDDRFSKICQNFAQKLKNSRQKSPTHPELYENVDEEYANFHSRLKSFALNCMTSSAVTSSTTNNNRLSIYFERLICILLDQKLADLCTENRSDRFNLRENNRSKNAHRFRHALNFVVANKQMMQNLHNFLLDNLPIDLLSIYLGFLHILHAKVPQFVARLIDNEITAINSASPVATNFSTNRETTFDKETTISSSSSYGEKSENNVDDERKPIFQQILTEFFATRVPDVLDIVLPDHKTACILAKDAILVLISPNFKVFGQQNLTGAGGGGGLNERYAEFCKLVPSRLGPYTEIKFEPFKKDTTLPEASKKLRSIVTEKLQELKTQHADRHVILLGYGPSSILALNVALQLQCPPVSAVVCFGFPNVSFNGVRGDVDDDFLDLECPVLFIVGQFASRSSLEDLQDMRHRMKSKNVGVVLVGGAGNDLKISRQKLCSENLTQKLADLHVLDCAAEFLNDILLKTPDDDSSSASKDIVGDEGGGEMQPEPSPSLQTSNNQAQKLAKTTSEPKRPVLPAVRRTADLLAPPAATQVLQLTPKSGLEPEKSQLGAQMRHPQPSAQTRNAQHGAQTQNLPLLGAQMGNSGAEATRSHSVANPEDFGVYFAAHGSSTSTQDPKPSSKSRSID